VTVQRRRIGVYGICRDGDRVLLVRRTAGALGGGDWEIPGGGINHGEDPRAGLVREFREETGLEITIDRLRLVRTDFLRYPSREQVIHLDRIIFDVAGAGGTLRSELGGSTDRAAYMTLAEAAAVPLRPWAAELLGLPVLDPSPGATAAEIAAAEPPTGGLITQVQRFAAYGLASDPAGRVLLTRIAPGYPGAGTWHLPGGGTDFGESATGGLARELAEETGQLGDVGDLLAIEGFHNPAAYGPERRPIDWHTVRTVFRVTVSRPTDPVVHDLGGSTDAAAWFTSAELGVLKLNRLARSVISGFRQ
jgi:8-oxo-dGTP diphosphatase